MEKDQSKKSTIISRVLGTVAFLICFFAVKHFLSRDIETELKKAVIKLNKQTPMQVDKYTRYLKGNSTPLSLTKKQKVKKGVL